MLKVFFGFKVIGKENIPEKGGVIVVTNHTSYLDPIVVGCAIKRRATFIARAGLFSIPLINVFVKSFSFPVDRGRPRPSTIKEAVRRLRKGELIVMFPEGARSKDGNLMDAKRGAGMIAVMGGAIVVPGYISGTYRALPTGARFIRPAKISIIFGNPIEVQGGTDRDSQEKISGEITEAIRKLKETLESMAWK